MLKVNISNILVTFEKVGYCPSDSFIPFFIECLWFKGGSLYSLVL